MGRFGGCCLKSRLKKKKSEQRKWSPRFEIRSRVAFDGGKPIEERLLVSKNRREGGPSIGKMITL